MPSFRTAAVTSLIEEHDGLQRVDTTLGRAYALTQLVGPVAVGDDVVLNTTAVDLDLGTGGWHVVHWNLARREWSAPGPGHIMKLRYTSLQIDTGAAEETNADVPADLGGMPVVACTLHSQVGVVATVLRQLRPSVRIAYVMTDGGALPLALSDLVRRLRAEGAIDATVTTGHAFGGELEAVSIPSGLVLARHVARADVVVAGLGPGVVGTGSALGTTAVEAATVLDSTAALGGRPILCARVSDADDRARHRGVSHHTRTVLDLVRSAVEVPTGDDVPDVDVTTMGRSIDDDPLFFAACAAAARAAVAHLP